MLASGKTVRVLDTETASELQRLREHGRTVYAAAFSPDGRRIVGVGGGSLTIWEAETGAVLLRLSGDEVDRGLRDVIAFSSDGRHIATSLHGTIRVSDAENGAELQRLQGHRRQVEVTCVAWSPDDRRLASGDSDTVCIWDVETATEIRCSSAGVVDLAFSPDGQRIAGVFYPKEDVPGASFMTVLCEVATGLQLEVLQGMGDVIAVAADPKLFPLRALIRQRGAETVIEDVAGRAVAYLSAEIDHLATHPDGVRWLAWRFGSDLQLFSLEGARSSDVAS